VGFFVGSEIWWQIGAIGGNFFVEDFGGRSKRLEAKKKLRILVALIPTVTPRGRR
jgi:hypothetical protein